MAHELLYGPSWELPFCLSIPICFLCYVEKPTWNGIMDMLLKHHSNSNWLDMNQKKMVCELEIAFASYDGYIIISWNALALNTVNQIDPIIEALWLYIYTGRWNFNSYV